MSDPELSQLSTTDFLRAFDRKSAELRIPLTGSIELTTRCNLQCRHCYLGSSDGVVPSRGNEMSTDEVLHLLDEIAGAGCLNLVMTGGEPLLRGDFPELYRHAKELGLLVTIFSNGTLIRDHHIALFAEFPPQAVEISLYGSSPDVYGRVTGDAGAFSKCMHGIRHLQGAGVQVRLKSLLLTLNRDDFPAIRKIAEDLNLPFRFDAGIFPKFNGDRSPLELRVSPEEAVAMEFSDPATRDQWKRFCDTAGTPPRQQTLYVCGAGVNSFHVDAHGHLKPCLMVPGISHDIRDRGFMAGWHETIPLIRQKKTTESNACNGCDHAVFCGYCPAFFALEQGREDIRSEYLCETGVLRRRRTLAGEDI